MLERATLARPYAKAIFEVASKSNTQAKWHSYLQVLNLIAQNSKVINLLKDRTIPLQRVANMFLEFSQNHLDEQGKNLITLLIFHRRMEVLPEISALYKALWEERENRVEVELSSSVKLDTNEQNYLKEQIGKYLSKTVNLQCKVDKDLLGGFLARAGNYVIDGSILGYLTNLKEQMGD